MEALRPEVELSLHCSWWSEKQVGKKLAVLSLWLQGGKLGGGIVRESGTDMYTSLYLKWITNKGLQYSTWNSAQCSVAAWIGGDFGGEWIHVYIWLSPFTVHLKLSEHC